MTIDPAPSRRERKKLETRLALEQAALRLFDEKGYDQTTVEDIAESADVAVRTFFRYFSSKQDVLFGEVVTDRISRLRTELANRPLTEDPLASVIAVMNLLNFSPAEEEQVLARMELMRQEIADPKNGLNGGHVEVRAFDNLLMHFVESVGAQFIVRGLRAVSDFEYEFQMAGMNARLNPKVETVFLMASEHQQFVSSRFIKEIGRLGGKIDEFVSPRVNAQLKKIFQSGR